MLTRTHRRWIGTVALIAGIGCLNAEGVAEPESPRSAPPDQMPYVRPAVPAESAPFGEPALGPKSVPQGGEKPHTPPSPGVTLGEQRKRQGETEQNPSAPKGG
jgi:hypothetical protein